MKADPKQCLEEDEMQPNMMSCGISETTSERRSDLDLDPHQVKSRIQIRMRKKLESDPRQSDPDP